MTEAKSLFFVIIHYVKAFGKRFLGFFLKSQDIEYRKYRILNKYYSDGCCKINQHPLPFRYGGYFIQEKSAIINC